MVGGNVRIGDFCRRIDNTEVHSLVYCVIEENGVHRFADIVVAAKRKGEITHATADVCTWKMFFNPPRGSDEVYRIIIVRLNPSGNRKYVRIKDYV